MTVVLEGQRSDRKLPLQECLDLHNDRRKPGEKTKIFLYIRKEFYELADKLLLPDDRSVHSEGLAISMGSI